MSGGNDKIKKELYKTALTDIYLLKKDIDANRYRVRNLQEAIWDDDAVILSQMLSEIAAAKKSINWADIVNKPTSMPPNGVAGGDLAGTYPNPTIGFFQALPVLLGVPALNDVITWDGSKWISQAGGGGGGGITSLNGLLGAAQTFTNDTNVTIVSGGTAHVITWAGTLANARLTNSSVTINGSAVSLGGSTTITASTTNDITISTGLQLNIGTTFNGSAARTLSIDSTVATLTGAQALSNKSGLISQWTNDAGYVTSSSPALTATYVGYGDGANLLTGDSNFTWGSAAQDLTVGSTVQLKIFNSANAAWIAQGDAGYWFTGTASTGLLGHRGFGVDLKTTQKYTMGDAASGSGNGNYFEINDTASTAKLTTLATNGFVKTSGGTGTLSVDTSTYITGLTVGTTAIGSGTTTRILYDNAGILGEYTITGTGTVVAMQTSPTFGTSITGSYLTASEILITDGSKNIVSAPIATYPSLTELSYVKGGNSNFQTQIDAIASTSIEDVVIKAYASLGSTIKAQTVGQSIARITSIGVLTNQLISFVAVYLNTSQTLTGVKWWQGALGSYTANNENRVGLYSYSGGTLTLVASSTNDGNLWQTAASASIGSKAFSSTYAAAAGLYYVAFLYCRSAVVTAPQIGLCANIQNANIQALDFTNSAKIWAYKTGVTALPATQAMSGLTADVGNFWISIY